MGGCRIKTGEGLRVRSEGEGKGKVRGEGEGEGAGNAGVSRRVWGDRYLVLPPLP